MVKKKFIHFLIVFLMSLAFLLKSQAIYAAIPAPGGGYWYRGNTHNHVKSMDPTDYRNLYSNSGLTPPYDFLAGYNHDYDPLPECPDQEADFSDLPGFLGICGTELSGSGHVTAFGINDIATATNYSGMQGEVTATINAGGVPIKNHPQDPVVSVSTFIGLIGLNHFEVANGGRPEQTAASETLWDGVLSASNGRKVYGVGADDNHEGYPFAKAWVMVKANSLTKSEIVNNFRNGNFYASTGVILGDYQVNKTARTITINSQNGNTITFIGKNGSILKTVQSNQATYQVSGNELYIRAKITNSAEETAWTQPIFVSEFDGGGPTPTPTPTSPTPSCKPSDINCDGAVNFFDLKLILSSWLGNGSCSGFNCNLNGDGKVNALDAAIVFANWGK